MNTRYNIRTAVASLLLLLFALGITPRQLLHDVITSHTDLSISAPPGKHASLCKTGFNCDCLDLVAESPFIVDGHAVADVLFRPHQLFVPPAQQDASAASVSLSSLRGPPAV